MNIANSKHFGGPTNMSHSIHFPVRGPFTNAVRERVAEHLKAQGKPERDLWQMYLKSAFIVCLAVISYIMLVFHSDTLIEAVIWGFLLAQSHIMIGFDVMHDAGHKGYSNNQKVNWFMSHLLDAVGASQWLWNQKHNMLHHTYTNIEELDDDLHSGSMFRLSPVQEHKWWHQFQHWYAFPIYALLSLQWIFYADIKEFIQGRLGSYKLPKPKTGDKFMFWGGKVFYLSYAVLVPLSIHPTSHFLIAFFCIHFVLGFTLSLVFQLAHIVETAEFPQPHETGALGDEWTVHQLKTTVNFARKNRFINFYVGGLNFQAEHHLFSRICHLHYPGISNVVKKTCEEFDVPYKEFPTLGSAIASHLNHLKALGQRPTINMEPAIGSA